MNELKFDFLKEVDSGVHLFLYVQPKASQNKIIGPHEDRLKIKISAPPVDGEANQECVRFFAKVLKVPKSDCQIVQGQTARQKTLAIRNVGFREILEKLNGLITSQAGS